MPGSIARSPDAGSPTSGWANGCVRCSSGWRARWAGASRSPARTGPTPRRPTASSPMTGSAKARSSPATFSRRETGLSTRDRALDARPGSRRETGLSTRDRAAGVGGPLMVLHDTTEFSYRRRRPERVGQTCRVNSGKDKQGRYRQHTVCGLLMHASLAVTAEGPPLGLAAVKFWTRKKFKGTAALKRKVNPTRVPIERKESVRWLDNMRQSTLLFGEPERCSHIGDRESDIYELFCLAQELGTHFLVRSCVDRLAGDGTRTVGGAMDEVPVQGRHRVEVRDGEGALDTAVVELSYRSLLILPPVGKRKRSPALPLTVLHAREPEEPARRPRID